MSFNCLTWHQMRHALKLKAIKEWEACPLLSPSPKSRPSFSFCCFPIMLQCLKVVVFYSLSSIYSCCLWRVGSIGSTWSLKEAETSFTKNSDAIFFLNKNFPEPKELERVLHKSQSHSHLQAEGKWFKLPLRKSQFNFLKIRTYVGL